VYGPLQTYLEKNQGFKLGLHERDFEAGKYIADNIIDVINRSKKIIFVISSSFLKSEWGQNKFEVVHTPIYNRQHYRLQRHHIGTPLNHRLTSGNGDIFL
jgi:hypothetical protein